MIAHAKTIASKKQYQNRFSTRSKGGYVKFDRNKDLPTAYYYFTEIEELELTGFGEWQSVVCPFHNDTSPSLRVNINNGAFRCMACGAKGGDVLAYHMLKHDLSFLDAVKAMKDIVAMESK